MKNKSRLLKQSLDWIRTHPNSTNLEVPADLRSLWIVEGDRPPHLSDFHMAVFVFGLIQAKVSQGTIKAADATPAALTPQEIIDGFYVWQTKLALAEIHASTDFRISPLPLFLGTPDDTIEIWPSRS